MTLYKRIGAFGVLLSLVFFMSGAYPAYAAGQSYDNSSSSGNRSGSTNYTYTYTANSNGTFIACEFSWFASSATNPFSNTKDNGSAMQMIAYQNESVGGGSMAVAWFTATTTSNLISYTTSSATTNEVLCGTYGSVNPSISYVPTATDSTTTTSTVGATSISNSITPITANSWVLTFIQETTNNGGCTASTGVTARTVNGNCIAGLGDSNAQEPTSPFLQTWNVSAGTDDLIMVQLTISPVATPAAGAKYRNIFLFGFGF